LENLAAGGDGLLDIGVPTKIPQPGQPPAQQLSFRLYEVDNPNVKQLAETLRQCFFNKGLESQIVEQGETFIVQGKKSGWVVYLGMGQAATVMLEPQAANLKISIGGGKWLEQGAAMAAGLWLLVPLFTGAFGMAQQKQLIDELWRLSENFVVTAGGHRIQ